MGGALYYHRYSARRSGPTNGPQEREGQADWLWHLTVHTTGTAFQRYGNVQGNIHPPARAHRTETAPQSLLRQISVWKSLYKLLSGMGFIPPTQDITLRGATVILPPGYTTTDDKHREKGALDSCSNSCSPTLPRSTTHHSSEWLRSWSRLAPWLRWHPPLMNWRSDPCEVGYPHMNFGRYPGWPIDRLW